MNPAPASSGTYRHIPEPAHATHEARPRTANRGPASATLLVVVVAIALGAYLRVFDITARPFHSDEGVNFGFLKTIDDKGYYPYSHENYHGPLFFYLSYFFYEHAGQSELSLRGWSIVSGLLMVPLVLLFTVRTGPLFGPLAALFIALSPTMIFQSRYFIHEMTMMLATLITGGSLYALLMTGRRRYLYLCALGLSAMIATKETWVITVAALGLATILTRSPLAFVRLIARHRSHVVGAYLVLFAVCVLSFTGGFVWAEGVRESFLAIPQWFGRGVEKDVGHFKPFTYYLWTVLGTVEPQALIAVLLSLLLTAAVVVFIPLRRLAAECSEENALLRFVAGWLLAVTAVYSAIPYKTPWCVVNISLPALLFLAALIDHLVPRFPKIVSAGAAITVASFVPYAAIYNYSRSPFPGLRFAEQHPFGAENPQSYVHTTSGMVQLAAEITRYLDAVPDARALIAINGYWPIPYYLRSHAKRLAYLATNDAQKWSSEYDVLVMEKEVRWTDPDFTAMELRLSDVEETRTYFRIPATKILPRCYTVSELTAAVGSEVAVCR